MRNIIIASFLLIPSLSFADVKFHCYSIPNQPVQSYEFSSPECLPGTPADRIGKNTEQSNDGLKEILCSYQAICAPVAENASNEPPERTAEDLHMAAMKGQFKGSVLLCKGRGALDKNGVISEANCPSPTRCQRDVLYNFGSRSMSPGTPKGTTIIKKGTN